jgi:demethylmenaquinone methyltransferase/2-methoxy-6-polyprenyl-1,4-benzoquinol methylase
MVRKQHGMKPQVHRFFGRTAKTYDKVVAWATFGRDDYWKGQILKHIPSSDMILDLACGTGILTRKIAEKFPLARVVGVDIMQNYLDVAIQNSEKYENISYVLQDAECLSLEIKFDCIVSSYIPKYCNPSILLMACTEHLKPSGKIIFHDFIYPDRPIRVLWDLYFVLLRLVGTFIPSWRDAFVELPKFIRASSWLEEYAQIMKKECFDVTIVLLTFGTTAILVGQRSNTKNKDGQSC